jgi:hypothetical protein
MTGLARLVGIFDRAAVVDVLTAAPAGHGRPEIVEHVPMKADPLSRGQPDYPYAHAFALRQKRRSDATIVVLPFTLEISRNGGRPCRLFRTVGRFIRHRQGHGAPPIIVGRI